VFSVEATSAEPRDDQPLDLDCIRQAHSVDDGIIPIMDCYRAGAHPDQLDIRQYPAEARILFGQWDSLVVHDDVLYRRYHHVDGITKFLQLVLPGALRRRFVEKLHAELGHFGQTKTALAVSRRAYFPSWRSFTHLVVRNCTVCNRSQRNRQAPRQAALQPMTELRPMAVLHADLVGPIPPGRNARNQRGF